MQSKEKAKKHIDISIGLKRIAKSCNPQYDVYVATHTIGSAGQVYQCIEEESGEEFWGITVLSPPRPRRDLLKRPDLLVAYQGQAKFVVEVKWGVIPGTLRTDSKLADDELEKIRAVMTDSDVCRVRGPAVKDHRRYHYRGSDCPIVRDYSMTSETKLVLVTDLRKMKQFLRDEYVEALKIWKNMESNIRIADINTHIDGNPSFREMLES